MEGLTSRNIVLVIACAFYATGISAELTTDATSQSAFYMTEISAESTTDASTSQKQSYVGELDTYKELLKELREAADHLNRIEVAAGKSRVMIIAITAICSVMLTWWVPHAYASL